MSRLSSHLVIYLCAFTGPLAGNAILVMVNQLETSLRVTEYEVLLAIPAFMIPFAILQLFSGTISDTWQRKMTILIGMALYGIASIGIAVAGSFLIFMLMRVGQGIGYAFVGPVSVAYLGDITDKSKYGIAMGFYGSAVTGGLTIGPLIAGYLTPIDWRLAFWVFAGIALIGVILIFMILPKIMTVQNRSKEGIFKNMKRAVQNHNLRIASVGGTLAFIAMIGILSYLAIYLSETIRLGAPEIGFVLAVFGIAGIFVSPIGGMLTDRCSPRLTVVLGFVIVACAIILLPFVSEFYHFIGLIAIAGGGGTFIWAGMLTITVEEIPALRGTTASIFNASRFAGYAASPIILMPLDIQYGFTGVVVAGASMLMGGLVISLLLTGRSCLSGREKALLGIKTDYPSV